VVQVEHIQEMAVATGEPEELVQPAVLLVAVVLEDTLVPVAKVEEVLIPLHMQALPVGGGGAGGALAAAGSGGGGGGGVGILGQGTNGAANPAGFDNGSLNGYQGGGGSGGGGNSATRSRNGGTYGGGSAGYFSGTINNFGSGGAVRIIWGAGRAFPDTLTNEQ